MKNIIIKNIKLLSLILIAVVIIVIILFINNNKDVNSVSNNNNVKVLDKSPVNIGFVGPILDNKYDYGLSTLKVLDIMAISINNAGGINGRPIHLIAEDGACDGEKAKFATDKLIREYKVKYIIGGICSGESLSMIDSINKNKVILMSPISTSAKLTNSSPYFFRNIVSDAYTAKSIADYIYNKDKSNKTLYVLSENTEYTRDFQEILSKAYTDKGGKIISTLDIDNFVSILKNIDTDKIKSIYINYQSTEWFFKLAKRLYDNKYEGNIYGTSLTNSDTVKNSKYLDGVTIFNIQDPNKEHKAYKGLVEAYKDKYKEDLPYPGYSAGVADILLILQDIITRYGEDVDKTKDHLHSGWSYNGLMGSYKFDKNGDVIGLGNIIQTVKNGELKNI